MILLPRNWLTTARRESLLQLIPLLILLIAFGLRLYRIETQSFWNDEGNTVRLIQRPVDELIAAAGRDIHPPGYYLILKAWSILTGESEFSLRLFSALAGLVTVACVYSIGRILSQRGVGWLAAAFTALNTFSIYYGQEARMYALTAAIAAGSLLCFVVWASRIGRSRRGAWQAGIGFALLNACGLYTHYTYPFVMLAQAVLALLLTVRSSGNLIRIPREASHRPYGNANRRPMIFSSFVVLNILTLILFAPQISTAIRQVTQWPRTGAPVDFGTGISTVAAWLTFGNSATNVPLWIYGVCILFALASLLPDWLNKPYPMVWRIIVPWIVLGVVIVPLFALGLYRTANLKFLLPAQFATALILARGGWYLWEIGSPSIVVFREALPRLIGGLGVFYLFTIYPDAINNLYTRPEYQRANYRSMAQTIQALETNGQTADSAIILDAPNQEETFTLYYQGDAPIFPLPRGLGGDDSATRAATESVIAAHSRIFVLYWGESERDPNRIVEKTLTESTFQIASNWFGDVRLVQYSVLRGDFIPFNTGLAQFTDTAASITLTNPAINGTIFAPGDVLGVRVNWTADRLLTKRYKVFLQLLNVEGRLVTQRDAEPGNNLILTTTWQPGIPVEDAHGLLIPPTTPDGRYSVIIGLYDLNDPSARLPLNGDPSITYLTLTTIEVTRAKIR